MKKTTKELKGLFTWPGISKQVNNFNAHSEPCIKHNKCRGWIVPMILQHVYSVPFECISMDIVGPFRPDSGSKMFILTSICRATGWPDCFALSSITTQQVENA